MLVALSSGGGLQTDSFHQFVEIVGHALVQAVNLRLPLLLQCSVAGKRTKQSCSKRSVDALEELEKEQRDGVAGGQQAISAGVRQFPNQRFGPELQQVIAQRCQTVVGRGTAERFNDIRIEFCRGERGTGSDVCEPDQCVHQRQLTRMIEF